MILSDHDFFSLNETVVALDRKLAGVQRKDVDSAVDSYRSRMDGARRELRRRGVDTDRVEREAEAVGHRIGERLSRGDVSKSLSALLEDTQTDFLTTFRTMYDDLGDQRDLESGVELFLLVLVANTVASVVLGLLIGPMAGMMATAAIVAPFTEETARREAIQRGYGLSSFTAAVNAFEFVSYVSNMLRVGMSLGVAVTIRLTLAVLHQFLGALQKWGYVKDIQAGVDPADAGRFEYGAAIFIHALNNMYGGLVWKAIFPKVFGEDGRGVRSDGTSSTLIESNTTSMNLLDVDLIIETDLSLSEGWFQQWMTGADGDTRRELIRLKDDIRTEGDRREALAAVEQAIDNSNRVLTNSDWKDWALSAGLGLLPVVGAVANIARVIARAVGSDDRQRFRDAMMELHTEIRQMKLKG